MLSAERGIATDGVSEENNLLSLSRTVSVEAMV